MWCLLRHQAARAARRRQPSDTGKHAVRVHAHQAIADSRVHDRLPVGEPECSETIEIEARQRADQRVDRQQGGVSLRGAQALQIVESPGVGERNAPLAVRVNARRCAPQPSAAPMSSPSARM